MGLELYLNDPVLIIVSIDFPYNVRRAERPLKHLFSRGIR